MMTFSPQFLVFDSKTGPKSEDRGLIYCSSKESKVQWPPSVRRGRPRKGGCSPKTPLKQVERSPKQRYEFVHCSDRKPPNDASSRKLVRTHVMHNHRRAKMRGVQDTEVEGQNSPTEPTVELAHFPIPSPGRWSRDPFDSFPLKMRPHMHELLYLYVSAASTYLYPIEALHGLNPTSTLWVPLALTDPALLSSLLFSSEQFSAKVHGQRVPSSALKHLTQAVRILNARLQNPGEEISDSTIAAVAGLALTEQASGNQANWRIHMRGIQRMVEMRGGMQAFHSRPILHDKLCRADICGSIYSLSQPYLQPQLEALPSYDRSERPLPPGFRVLHHAYGFDAYFLDILYDVHSVTEHLKTADLVKSDIIPSRLRSQIRSVQYRLLSAQNAATSTSDDIDHLLATCHLSLLLYTGIVQNEFWASPVSAQFVKQLQCCLGRRELFVSEAMRAMRVWLLFLSGAVISEQSERTWIAEGIEKVAEELKLRSWIEVRGVLEEFAWVPKVMDRGGEELWGELVRM
ncbi:hypothetical protein BU16DRAFT_623637 [Lophium mytilinum]|uniref:Uncharacterized protein n=1 Tax=Lophium mytilinum TaxID=390894 RepID=A0A6A6Q7P8_9PEZI|nr:hypothetical protein BU16DRAFT_623637 [Lophium mytilinum]